MKEIKLKNGALVHEAIITTTMINLDSLLKKCAEATPESGKATVLMYEILEKSKNPDYEMFGDTCEDGKRLGLIDNSNRMHDTVRNIIVSALTFDGASFTLNNPVANSSQSENVEDSTNRPKP